MTSRMITQTEDAMQPQTPHPELQGWQRLVGTWVTEATHPALPGTVISGQATFEWLEDQRFLIQRSHYDHPEIPDAIAVTGIIDGKPSMHYFDPRGVHVPCAHAMTGSGPAAEGLLASGGQMRTHISRWSLTRGHVDKAAEVALEGDRDRSGRAVAVLGHDEVRLAGPR